MTKEEALNQIQATQGTQIYQAWVKLLEAQIEECLWKLLSSGLDEVKQLQGRAKGAQKILKDIAR